MEVTEERHIKSGKEYDHLFPKSALEKISIKKGARLDDTIKFLPEAIKKTLYQTKDIVKVLIGETPYETCRKIWQFVFDHIEYRKDEQGKEQIQSPQYTWAVRKGDCDDYTVMIVSIIMHIAGMKPILRIAAYDKDTGYQHIYPVVFLPTGEEVTMDCVAKKFDYEVPYIYKKDKHMELQFLNGLEGTRNATAKLGIDADDLLQGYDGDDVGDLGRKGKASKGGGGGKAKNFVKKVQNTKAAQTVRKGLHLTNKINPAAALLRTGILIALKTNLFRIAERLRFSYLTPQQITERGMDMDKYNRLIGVRDQLEKIFFRAGGELKNFKKEILTGRGNRDKQVPLSGLGAIDTNDYNQYHSPMRILGLDTYSSEMNGVEGLGELGEAFTAGAAVTAATGALTAIAALLKSIGDLKKKPSKGSADTKETTESGEDATQTTESSTTENPSNSGDSANDSFFKSSDETAGAKSNGGGGANKSPADTPYTTSKPDGSTTSSQSDTEDNTSSTGEQGDNSDGGGDNENSANARSATNNTPSVTARTDEGFLTKAGNWVKKNPVPTVLGVLVIGGGIYALVKYFSKDENEKATKHKAQLAGLPHSKNKKAYYKAKVRTYRLK